MKKSGQKNKSSVWGYLIFFVTVAFTITLALCVFVAVNRKTEGDPLLLTVTMILVILAVSGLFTLADSIRRKIMVDKPVEKILESTARLAKGDFSVRLIPEHSYEALNDYDEIMENVNRLAQELSQSEILKSDFIANVSHEIKTPLAVIQSYVSLLDNPSLSEEERTKYVRTVKQATQRLSGLVGNILKLNKLERQAFLPEREEFRLDEMLAETVLSFEEVIEKKELVLECDLEEVKIVSSPTHLEIVWNNLLSNAIKFTEKGGKIGVKLAKTAQGAQVTVWDTGCGISPETGARIFDKFYQGETSHAGEGNGLGLALVKKVIDLLGGEIKVESELDKGTSFTVVLKGL